MSMTLPLDVAVRCAGGPPAVREYCFHPDRRWRFDYAWPALFTALEYEGGTSDPSERGRGRHVRPRGYEEDCVKYAEAALLGWCVVRATHDMARDGRALALATAALRLATPAWVAAARERNAARLAELAEGRARK